MSAQGGGQKQPAVLLYVGAVLAAGAVGAVAYAALVMTENTKGLKLQKQADHVEQEIVRGNMFLKRHQTSRAMLTSMVDDSAAELQRRVPDGPVDLDVGSYIDQAAQQAGIIDSKWSVEGGLKVPKQLTPNGPTPAQRLLLEPNRLKRSTIIVEFTSRYRACLYFLRSLAEAPWPIEISNVKIQRQPPGAKLLVKIEMRYAFE